jgi:hypothetical protein
MSRTSPQWGDNISVMVEQSATELKLAADVVHQLTAPYQASHTPLPAPVQTSLGRLRTCLSNMRGSIDTILGSLNRAGVGAQPGEIRNYPAELEDPTTCLPLARLGPGHGYEVELRVCQSCCSHFSAPAHSFECFCTDCVPR